MCDIKHVDSQTEPYIQAADYRTGSCFRRFEYNNDSYYYDLIKIRFRYS